MIYHQGHNSKGNYNYNAFIYSSMSWAPHFHKNFELIYLLEGRILLTVNGKSETMESGDCALILSHQIHSFEEQQPSRGLVVVFSEQFVPYFANRMEKSQGQRSVFRCDTEIDALLHAYLIRKNAEQTSIAMKKSCFYALCDQFLQKVPIIERKDRNDDLICRIFDYISEHYTEDLTLASVAEHFGYEYHYLSRILNRGYHINFSHLLNEFRMDHALHLLESTDKSMTEIAMESGFRSIRNFNHVFREHTGASPGNYNQGLANSKR